jgi:Concanavalin A-like lectin/glucanases superfamily
MCLKAGDGRSVNALMKILFTLAAMGLLAFTVHAQNSLTNGLVAYYPFSGNANDAVGTNNGIIHGGVTLTADRAGSYNSAYLFNGVDGYINVGSPAGTNPTYLSEVAWVKIISREAAPEIPSPAEDIIISKRQESLGVANGAGWPELGVVSSGPNTGEGVISVAADYYTDDCIGTQAIATNVWFCICEVCSNGTYQLYLNGSLEGIAVDSHPLTSFDEMHLMNGGAWATFCNGVLDDVRIYNRPLSANEVAQLYNSEVEPHAAMAAAVLFNNFLVGASVTDNGAGYTNTPAVRFFGGGGGGAEAVAVVSNGLVTAINILSAGYGYTNAPLIVVDPPFINSPGLSFAPISQLTFNNLTVGANYQLQQFQSPYWVNVATNFTTTSTVSTQRVPGAPGSSTYRLVPSPVPAQAYATPMVINGFLVGADITIGGSGYSTPPTVMIVGDVGSGAIAAASVSGGAVTNIVLTDAGTDYADDVMIEIAPPPANALYPTFLPGLQLNSSGLIPYGTYQLQYQSALGTPWQNWGSSFISTNPVNSQSVLMTNSAGFFRMEYVPVSL